MKITAYIIYIVLFTFCYYFLNRKLSNKWIFILYPLLFVIPIFPLKIWFQYARLHYGNDIADSWLKILLMTSACFCLFNIVYSKVNFMVNTQVNFHLNYGRPNTNFIKNFINSESNIKSFLHFFF